MNRITPTFLITTLLACSPDITPGAGPAITRQDSLVLREPESDGVFMPLRSEVLLPDGGLVADVGNAINHFSHEGELVRVLGRPGTGPGEFQRISTVILLPGDTILAAVDARRGRIVSFHLASGRLLGERAIQPFFPGRQWLRLGDTMVMPAKLSQTPFFSWSLANDTLWSWGSAPEVFTSSTGAYSQGGEPSIARYGTNQWLATFPADPRLYLMDASGAVTESFELPQRRRRGVPAGIGDSVAAIAASGDFRYAASLVFAIWQLRTGDYMLVHLDADPVLDREQYSASGGKAGLTYTRLDYWVSFISRDLGRACVDTRIPIELDNIVIPFFHDDEIHFMDRTVSAASGQLETILRSFRVTDRGCDWIATSRSTSESRP